MALFGIGKKEKKREVKVIAKAVKAEGKARTEKKSPSEKRSTPSTKVDKTKSEFPKEKKVKQGTVKEALSVDTNLSGILLRPRITEKATFSAEKGVYVFEVSGRSTKKTITEAIKRFYKVTPAKVNIVKIPAKVRISKWRKARGVKPGGKKAYVHLKEGDRIEIV